MEIRVIVEDIHLRYLVDEERELSHEEMISHENRMNQLMEINHLNIDRITKEKQIG
jgi:hypothetical protein